MIPVGDKMSSLLWKHLQISPPVSCSRSPFASLSGWTSMLIACLLVYLSRPQVLGRILGVYYIRTKVVSFLFLTCSMNYKKDIHIIIINWATSSEKVPLNMSKMCGFRSPCTCPTYHSGPSCSKLTTSLVNDLLKFTLSDTQICLNFLLKKCE